MRKPTFASAVLCVLLMPQGSQAQVLYGSIVGNIQDASEALIAGATVTLISVETKQSRVATTGDSGAYTLATLVPGLYDIKVTKQGFTTATRTGILVTANNTLRVDIALNVGAVTESLTVSGTTALLQTDRAEVRTDVDTSQLTNLPMSAGRNYQTLFVTLPGFGGIQASYNSTPSNPSKALVFNVNGASFNINNTKIDGAQSINVWLPHESAYVPTLEAIDVVNVVSGSFDAETGLAGGANI